MASEKVPMLAEGHRHLNDELRRLKVEERPAIIEAIEEARAHGDLSENAEYHAAKERQGQIEATIADLEDRLSRAMVIDPTTLSGDKIVFGATVTLLDEDDKKVKYQLVGQTEADARVGRISYNSPLGRALIGREKGDEVEVTTPSGDKYYEVAKIEFV
ncbi:transcription elongation factor GreA [Sphingomonas alba]|uniref:Transcription elongation factor GreA n=1 Tax=Sphingomonas alba TaxID=2908208 RepID=A0ABT0RIP0_9SPHN|nr:transcription elongation factor GreA [Sphingomonas alba]MCL6682493.1 transcription elongation factor GreA [Sphingomonas alba]